jgi:hypothetical protein
MPESDRAYEFVVIESRPLWNVGFWHFADLGSAIFVTSASRMKAYVAIPIRLPTGELTDWRD